MMMNDKPLILNIETATNICSVALCKGDVVINYIQSSQDNAHSKMLAVFIESVFNNSYYKMEELDAVAVSKGPGSYTGLRIGVSSAKGLAYAKDIPLISIDTLLILAWAARNKHPKAMYMPMIDARRMEVYTALYDDCLRQVKNISADIVDKDIYSDIKAKEIILLGDGALKCKEYLTDSRYVLDKDISLSAKYMAALSYKKYKDKAFEDVAYFEPYYLKEFIAIKSKVKGLYNN